jgi:hypothetical protein
MLKRRLIAVLTGIALMMAVVSVSSIVADTLGLSVTSQAYACGSSSCNCNGSGGGGGC